MAKIRFHVDIHEENDGSYWAEVKELPGCFASGFSMDEVQEATSEAIQMWLPDGIVLDNAKWRILDDAEPSARGKAGKGKKLAPRRKMLVCA
jgi:predicted RNase H-like HicB family nuclease